MDFIGLVKDSFEAVVHEVESACQRKPAQDPWIDSCEAKDGDADAQSRTASETAGPVADADSDPPAGEESNPPTPEPSEMNSGQEGNGFRSDADISGQLRLLADTMRQASIQLSAAAVVGSSESGEESEPEPLDELRQDQSELRRLFESRIHSDEVQARALERLHLELQDGRKQIQRTELAPVLKDIIFCHDFVVRELDHDQSGGEPDWRKSFELLGQMLLDVLFKYDVEPFQSDSDEFDRSLQQCVKTEATDEPEQDRRISSVGLAGFRNEERIIRREQVTVFRYRPTS